MRDLNIVAKECMKMLDDIGIKYGHITEFKVNTRAIKRWGQCKRVPGGYSINISATLLDERNDINGLKNTILHELLHSCEGCMNHGDKWKFVANKVNIAYGYNIKRCSSSDEKGVDEDMRPVQYKYEVMCEKCGNVYKRSKMSNVVQHPERYRCGCCQGKLKRIK